MSVNRSYAGQCHCGAVQFSFSCAEITHAMRCDCSICARKGMVMTDHVIQPQDMQISDKDGVLSIYQFGSQMARHHFCSRCGIHTFVETRLNPGCYRVNLGCVEGVDALRLPSDIYPGKSL